jgi:hypothetical protein
MNWGCCDICERCAEIYPHIGARSNTLYLCAYCKQIKEDYDNYDTNDGTLAPAGGVRDGR